MSFARIGVHAPENSESSQHTRALLSEGVWVCVEPPIFSWMPLRDGNSCM